MHASAQLATNEPEAATLKLRLRLLTSLAFVSTLVLGCAFAAMYAHAWLPDGVAAAEQQGPGTSAWPAAGAPLIAAVALLGLAVLAARFTRTRIRQSARLQCEIRRHMAQLAACEGRMAAEAAERRRERLAAAQATRLHRLLSGVGSAIVRAADSDRLLEQVCRLAVEAAGFAIARAALEGDDGAWNLVATRGAALHGVAPNGETAGTCEGIGKPVCSRPQDERFGTRVSLTLRVNGRAAGMLSLYTSVDDVLETAQIRMLDGMADDLSFALENIERDAGRRKTEEQLRKLSRAVEQSTRAVMITDAKGIIEYVNPCFSSLTGYRVEDVVGCTPRLLKSSDMPAEVYRNLWETLLAGREWHGELHNTRKDGQQYWSYVVISPLKDDEGHITQFVAVSEDISARRHSAHPCA
ncbi:MAG TPA: PAS domain S-box protein [Noviherbaspirillum sp.]|uniref:PAS domain S-box protein n=1 Tax=Noviherbaspirillum sp. TaxID=1926288 RepID=UPI002F93F91B